MNDQRQEEYRHDDDIRWLQACQSPDKIIFQFYLPGLVETVGGKWQGQNKPANDKEHVNANVASRNPEEEGIGFQRRIKLNMGMALNTLTQVVDDNRRDRQEPKAIDFGNDFTTGGNSR